MRNGLVIHMPAITPAGSASRRECQIMAAHLPAECRELLELQHGVITRAQALRSGLPADSLESRLRYGRWRPLYRGVYLTFTGEPPRLAQLWGAVLRCGPGSALSHHTAAELDNLADAPSPAIHVTVHEARRISVPGDREPPHAPQVVVHRSSRIERAIHPARIPPRTRIEETVVDLTQLSASLEDASGWLTRACSRRLTTEDLLLTAMSARAKLRWRPDLTAVLTDIHEGIHSRLEWRYVRHVEQAHGLPRAIRQARNRSGQRTRYLDNEYRQYRLVVELDGKAAHLPEARWRDIHRDNASAAAGLLTLRYGWVDVTVNRCLVAAEVARVLQTRGWPGPLRPCGPDCAAPS
jgi:hypothetical protein